MKEKLKNLFNKKPIKIIVRAIGVLSTLFTILIIILLCVGSCSSKAEDPRLNELSISEKNLTNKIYNVVQNDISDSEKYRFYSINDLTSFDVMTNMLNYDRERNNYLMGSSTHRFTFTPQNLDDNYIVDGGDTQHYDYTGFQLKYRISGCTFEWYESNYRILLKADFTIVGLNSTTTLGHFQVDNVRYKIDGIGLDDSVCSYFHDTNDVGLTLLLNNTFYIRCRQTNQSYNLFDFLGLGNFTSYQDAYNNGVGAGYSQGYDVGYQAGINAGTGSTDNMFTIIMRGFSAVSSLLNITIMPGLTLGTLLFLPLAIVVVIAVFHLFKG